MTIITTKILTKLQNIMKAKHLFMLFIGLLLCSIGCNNTEEPTTKEPSVKVEAEKMIAEQAKLKAEYENETKKGGQIFVDSSLIERKVERDDVTVYYIPATRLASENGFPTLANMILMGKLLEVLGGFNADDVKATLSKVISAKRADMLETNLKALKLGADF